MTIYEVKPAFQRLLRPLTGALARAGVTANQVTVAAMLLSIVVGAAVAHWHERQWVLCLVPITLFVRMALNAIDGMLAREHGMKSAIGGILNELGDVVSDVALYLPFAAIAGIFAPLVVVVVVLSVLSEMAGVVAVQIGASRRYDGPMGKSDRAFAFSVLAMLVGLGLNPEVWADGVLVLIALLTAATVVNRSRCALHEINEAR